MRTVSVRALQRGLAILEYLNKWNGATVKDIMALLGTPHATTYRLLKTLCDQDLLTKGNDRGEYWLSAGVKALSAGYQTEAWLIAGVMPVIEALTSELHWPVFLMLPRAGKMVVRAKNFAPCPLIKGEIPTGTVSDCEETAGGLAYLAHGASPEVAESPALRRKLAAFCKQGYARHDERKNNLVQIAVPLRHDERVWGALMTRCDKRACADAQSEAEIADRLLQAADQIVPYLPIGLLAAQKAAAHASA